jgi:hypothetical protein
LSPQNFNKLKSKSKSIFCLPSFLLAQLCISSNYSHRVTRDTAYQNTPLPNIIGTNSLIMAPISEGISHPHNRPGSKTTNLRTSQKSSPYRARCGTYKLVRYAWRSPSFGNRFNNSNPPPPPLPPAINGTSGSEPVNSSPEPTDKDGGGMSTLEKMLSPPEADNQPQSKHQNVKVFVHCHYTPSITAGPFIPQPHDPSKAKNRPFNNKNNEFDRRARDKQANRSGNGKVNHNGSDGDDKDDHHYHNDSHVDPDAEALNMPSTPSFSAAHFDPPATSRPIVRSRAIDHDPDLQTTSLSTYAQQPKRKRDESNSDIATPKQGQRVFKRQRNSIGDSPLPPMPPIKRTRGQQKKLEAKLDYLFYDPERPGSVEREAVEIKSGSKAWRKASLHDEPWGGKSNSD